MRIVVVTSLIAALFACGGGEPAAEPAKAEVPEAEPAPADKEEATPAAADEGAAEAMDEAAPDLATMSDEDKMAYLMKIGEEVYLKGGSGGIACTTCHQANGEGLPPSFPPIKGQKEWMGDCGKHAGYVINGLKGEIEVAGVTYNGVMPAQANLSDLEIAAVLTYERNSWGNDYGLCMPEAVAAAR